MQDVRAYGRAMRDGRGLGAAVLRAGGRGRFACRLPAVIPTTEGFWRAAVGGAGFRDKLGMTGKVGETRAAEVGDPRFLVPRKGGLGEEGSGGRCGMGTP